MVGEALAKAPMLMGLQLAAKAFNFILNVAVARRVDVRSYGIAYMDFTLAYNLVFFLVSEPLRLSAQKHYPKEGSTQREWDLIALTWRTVLSYGMLIGLAVPGGLIFLSDKNNSIAHYRAGIAWCGLGAILALLAEPCFTLASVRILKEGVRARVTVEFIALSLHSLATFVFVSADLGVLAFAYAQVVYGAATLIGWWVYFLLKKELGILTKPLKTIKAPSAPDLTEAFSTFCSQTVLASILIEGEKMVLITLGVSTQVRGSYSLVSNLGSLVVRIIFLPLEETAYIEFCKLSGVGLRKDLSRSFVISVKLVSLLGCLCASFGPSSAWRAIDILYGPKWSRTDAPQVLALYCFYVLALALNGVSERFVKAVKQGPELVRYTNIMFIFSAIQVTSMYVLASRANIFGLPDSCGPVIAILFASSFRVLYSFKYANSILGTASVLQALPSPWTIAYLSIVSLGLKLVNIKLAAQESTLGRWRCHGIYIITALIILILTLIVFHLLEPLVAIGFKRKAGRLKQE